MKVNSLNLPPLEDENELDQFATSPLMDEVARQQAPTSNVADDGADPLENEMSTHDELTAETADLAAKAMPEMEETEVVETEAAPQELSQKDKLAQLMQAYQAKRAPAQAQPQSNLAELQKAANDNDQKLNWFKIGDKLATAYGNRHGGKGQGFGEIYDGLAKQGRQPIADHSDLQKDEATEMTLQNEREMNDANSDISKFSQAQAVAVAKKMGIPEETVSALTQMTANQLKKLGFKAVNPQQQNIKPQQQSGLFGKGPDGKLFPMVFDGTKGAYLNPLTGQVVGPDTEIMRNVLNTDAFGNKVTFGSEGVTTVASSARKMEDGKSLDNKVESFSPDKEQRGALDDEAKRMDSLTKNANEKIGAANRILQSLDGDSKQALAVIKTQMPRLAGEVGNLNQSEQEVWGGSQAWLDRLQQFVTTGITSELTEDNKRELRAVLGPFLEDATNSISTIQDQSANRLASVYNIPPAFAKKAYGAIKNVTPRQQEVMAGKTGTPNKALRTLPPGKTVVKKGYNPKTNQTQFVYSDGTKKVVDGQQ